MRSLKPSLTGVIIATVAACLFVAGPAASATKKEKVPKTTAKFFAVFSQKPVKAPRDMRQANSPEIPKGMGPDLLLKQVRSVPDPRSSKHGRWFLAPAKGDGLALYVPPTRGISAATLAQICGGGNTLWFNVPGKNNAYYGASTDDITSVVATGAVIDGKPVAPVEVPVRHNVWQLNAPRGTTSLTLRRGDTDFQTISTRFGKSGPCDPGTGVPPKR